MVTNDGIVGLPTLGPRIVRRQCGGVEAVLRAMAEALAHRGRA